MRAIGTSFGNGSRYPSGTPMKTRIHCFGAVGLTWLAGAVFLPPTNAQAALRDGLIAYWPMEEVVGDKTPDLVSGYDMTLNNLTAADLVAGKSGTCFSFSNAKKTLLSRVHGENDDLPVNKNPAFTISFWAKVAGTGQADLRLFSEGFTPSNNDPLFNLGTDSGGTSGKVDVFLRQAGWTVVNHIKSEGEPFDDTWHLITFVQQVDGSRKLYVDAVADALEIPAKEAGDWKVNDTTIGGILRASTSHWVTGLIDEVALWKRPLSEAEIGQLKNEGLVSVFPPVAKGLVAHWPLDEVVGDKTPDLVNGYDMTLNNLSAGDLVEGKRGKCFAFNNATKTLLSRVHGANDDLPANKHDAFSVVFWAKVAGTGQADLRLFSEGFTPSNNDPLFNIGTDSGGASGKVDLFFRQAGWTVVNHIKSEAEPFDDTWHQIAFIQQADGSRKLYVDGVADALEIPAKPAGNWNLNDTTIGGILRASTSHWVTGLIDDVAIWKRAISEAELAEVKASGVPAVVTKKQPLELKSFSAEFQGVAAGDKVVMHWEGSKDANYSITPAVGDVTASTSFGVGVKEIVVTDSQAYTLTATRGNESVSKQVQIRAIPGVSTGWRVIDTFTYDNVGTLATQGPWLNPEGVVGVIDLGANKVIGYDAGSDLAAAKLESMSIKQGQKGTLFFRIYVPVDTGDAVPLPIVAHIGLTERPIRGNGDFAGNVGPYLRIERTADGGTIDLMARNGVAAPYEVVSDAIQPGKVYGVWIDVDNKAFDVVDGTQTGGDVYSVHIQKEGDATRTTVFQDYVADRDAVTIDPALGAPGNDLVYAFLATTAGGQGTNALQFDDFFLSLGAYNSTLPIAAASFIPVSGPPGPVAIARTGGDLTLSWQGGGTLESASSIGGLWSAAANQNNPQVVTATGGQTFYRIAR